MSQKKQMTEIELEFLPTGGIRVPRKDPKHNRAVMEFLAPMLDSDQIAELERFFEESDETTLLFGDRVYCG